MFRLQSVVITGVILLQINELFMSSILIFIDEPAVIEWATQVVLCSNNMHVSARCLGFLFQDNLQWTVTNRLPLSFLSHPTSCCSAAELMSVLFFHTMRYKADDPRNQCNDRFVLSKVGVQYFGFVDLSLLACMW